MLQGGGEMVNEINYNKATSSLYAYKSLNVDIASSRTVTNSDGSKSFTAESVSLRSESASTSALTYNGAMQLNDMAKLGYEKLRSFVENLLQEQGINTKISTGDRDIDISEIDSQQAQDLISEDGYFGVKQTSERIFQLAIGIAGGDTSRIDAIKEGIDKGFEEAKNAFNGWLPDISYDTYDAVMEKLNNWVTDSSTVV